MNCPNCGHEIKPKTRMELKEEFNRISAQLKETQKDFDMKNLNSPGTQRHLILSKKLVDIDRELYPNRRIQL